MILLLLFCFSSLIYTISSENDGRLKSSDHAGAKIRTPRSEEVTSDGWIIRDVITGGVHEESPFERRRSSPKISSSARASSIVPSSARAPSPVPLALSNQDSDHDQTVNDAQSLTDAKLDDATIKSETEFEVDYDIVPRPVDTAIEFMRIQAHAVKVNDIRNINSTMESLIIDQIMISNFLGGANWQLINQLITEKLRMTLNPNCNVFMSGKEIISSSVYHGHFISLIINTPHAQTMYISIVCLYQNRLKEFENENSQYRGSKIRKSKSGKSHDRHSNFQKKKHE